MCMFQHGWQMGVPAAMLGWLKVILLPIECGSVFDQCATRTYYTVHCIEVLG
jgi:hypothetical protein